MSLIGLVIWVLTKDHRLHFHERRAPQGFKALSDRRVDGMTVIELHACHVLCFLDLSWREAPGDGFSPILRDLLGRSVGHVHAAQCSERTSACSRTVIVAFACLSGG